NGAIGNEEAFVWTSSTGRMQSLGTRSPTGSSRATCVSGDGRVVAGFDSGDAFRWTAAGGLRLVDASIEEVHEVSADGTTIVGRRMSGFRGPNDPILEAFRWTQAAGIEL